MLSARACSWIISSSLSRASNLHHVSPPTIKLIINTLQHHSVVVLSSHGRDYNFIRGDARQQQSCATTHTGPCSLRARDERGESRIKQMNTFLKNGKKKLAREKQQHNNIAYISNWRPLKIPLCHSFHSTRCFTLPKPVGWQQARGERERSGRLELRESFVFDWVRKRILLIFIYQRRATAELFEVIFASIRVEIAGNGTRWMLVFFLHVKFEFHLIVFLF